MDKLLDKSKKNILITLYRSFDNEGKIDKKGIPFILEEDDKILKKIMEHFKKFTIKIDNKNIANIIINHKELLESVKKIEDKTTEKPTEIKEIINSLKSDGELDKLIIEYNQELIKTNKIVKEYEIKELLESLKSDCIKGVDEIENIKYDKNIYKDLFQKYFKESEQKEENKEKFNNFIENAGEYDAKLNIFLKDINDYISYFNILYNKQRENKKDLINIFICLLFNKILKEYEPYLYSNLQKLKKATEEFETHYSGIKKLLIIDKKNKDKFDKEFNKINKVFDNKIISDYITNINKYYVKNVYINDKNNDKIKEIFYVIENIEIFEKIIWGFKTYISDGIKGIKKEEDEELNKEIEEVYKKLEEEKKIKDKKDFIESKKRHEEFREIKRKRKESVNNSKAIEEIEKGFFPRIRKILDEKGEINYADVYELFFNKDNGLIKNIEDMSYLENVAHIVNILYNTDNLNRQILFGKIYPNHVIYYNDV